MSNKTYKVKLIDADRTSLPHEANGFIFTVEENKLYPDRWHVIIGPSPTYYGCYILKTCAVMVPVYRDRVKELKQC